MIRNIIYLEVQVTKGALLFMNLDVARKIPNGLTISYQARVLATRYIENQSELSLSVKNQYQAVN